MRSHCPTRKSMPNCTAPRHAIRLKTVSSCSPIPGERRKAISSKITRNSLRVHRSRVFLREIVLQSICLLFRRSLEWEKDAFEGTGWIGVKVACGINRSSSCRMGCVRATFGWRQDFGWPSLLCLETVGCDALGRNDRSMKRGTESKSTTRKPCWLGSNPNGKPSSKPKCRKRLVHKQR